MRTGTEPSRPLLHVGRTVRLRCAAAMLSLPLRLFADEPRALHVVQDAYRFVMADEAQDTCHTQFKLLQQVVALDRGVKSGEDVYPHNLSLQRAANPGRFLRAVLAGREGRNGEKARSARVAEQAPAPALGRTAPVIGVPTSVGYGTADGGRTALNAMLCSCAAGLAVVGIDDGFGAGTIAARIARASRPSSDRVLA